jgi:hypothetical protein
LPERGVPLDVGDELEEDELLVGVELVDELLEELDVGRELEDDEELVDTGDPDLGKYLMPVDGQLPDCPTGAEATKVPVCTEPMTSKLYQISSRAPLEQRIITGNP